MKPIKIFLAYAVLFIAAPLLIIAVIEVFLTVAYYATGLNAFERRLDAHQRSNKSLKREFNNKGVPGQSENILRVAVFGGSSAAGYGSPMSFSELLANSIFSGREFQVDNYAKYGEPFVNFQAELLKSVISDYDVFIVYAGHNEIWNKLYARAKNASKDIFLPNGKIIPSGPGPYVDLSIRLQLLRARADGATFSAVKVNLLTWVLDNSRLFWVARKLYIKSSHLYNIFVVGSKATSYPSFFYGNYFITREERESIPILFKTEIEDISGKLKSGQKLVVVAPLVNELFPPLAQVIHESSADIEKYEQVARESYSLVSDGDYLRLRSLLPRMPKGAHKKFLEAMLCIDEAGSTRSNFVECLKIAESAREMDDLPYRVVPEISSAIRGMGSTNVIVVDAESYQESITSDMNSYNSYFVDFHHPSALGHLLIADLILNGLHPGRELRQSATSDTCGEVTVRKNGYLEVAFTPNRGIQHEQFEANIAWLENFISSQPSPFPYNRFLEKAKFVKDICNRQQR